MYKQRISFIVFVFTLLLLNQVSFARLGPPYKPPVEFGKRGSIRGRFFKVCNNCRHSPEQIFLFLSLYHWLVFIYIQCSVD